MRKKLKAQALLIEFLQNNFHIKCIKFFIIAVCVHGVYLCVCMCVSTCTMPWCAYGSHRDWSCELESEHRSSGRAAILLTTELFVQPLSHILKLFM